MSSGPVPFVASDPEQSAALLACPKGYKKGSFSECFAPFRYCPEKGCGRTEHDDRAFAAGEIVTDGEGQYWRVERTLSVPPTPGDVVLSQIAPEDMTDEQVEQEIIELSALAPCQTHGWVDSKTHDCDEADEPAKRSGDAHA